MSSKTIIINVSTRIQAIVTIGFFLLFTLPSLFFIKDRIKIFYLWNCFCLLLISFFVIDIFKPKYYKLYVEDGCLCWDTPDEKEKIPIVNIEAIELGGGGMRISDDAPLQGFNRVSLMGGTVVLKKGEDIIMPSALARSLASKKNRKKLEKYLNHNDNPEYIDVY